eukprot:CAMPEP_0113946764 /NCGR_PEP_ID=MMETSP1339-20121228/60012_1 /TAXON_ID=94617 /ORGANISM="Fibrocapsa japonica" /LENGTH=600 /DNA_ID=CAMNT_0000953003 /DNA_START=163 /DNA_END=1965 /DNA_ORIENTATION=+ /assembly_acc=CAM_ASM_000762
MMSSTPVVEETAALGDVTTYTYLESAVSAGLVKAFGDDFKDAKPMLTLSTRPEFGDYQCNAAMPLAKALKSKPRDIAQRLVEALEVGAACEQPEIAGPGFINLRLRPEFVTSRLQAMVRDPERLGVPRSVKPQRVVVDFSSPNIAKEMHVGHLRSTIIGDTLCRVLDFLGHDVVRLNHVGDWGTQFGMLIAYLKEVKPEALTNPKSAAIGDLVQFYKQAKARFDEDDKFKTVSRAEVVKLQSGDEENYKAWQLLCEISRQEFDQIYSLLNIKINERGESFYNEFLPDVVNDLEEKGLAVKSEGATCVFLEGFKNRDGQAMPLIIRKTDGGFMYSTTDLAAIRHRVEEEKADRILYVTDVGQSSHFSQVFQVARRAGILPDSTELQHVPFGLVQGEDGKKFKTRSGDTVKLKDLLMEAVNIATADMEKRYADEGQEMGEAERLAAQVVGLGAVKYADLSMNRESDYRFSYKKMLSLTGNTAPYMLYAYVRVKGIQRKGAEAVGDFTGGDIVLQEESEINLARKLLRLPEVLAELESDLYPHKLCEYLFDVSQKFNKFYESCPVNTAETEELKRSRVALCEVTANVIKKGLSLLGIDTVDKL